MVGEKCEVKGLDNTLEAPQLKIFEFTTFCSDTENLFPNFLDTVGL